MHKVRIWEENEKIIGVVFFETYPVDVFFNVHPDYEVIKSDMLAYAEQHLTHAYTYRFLRIFTGECDLTLQELAKSRQYQRRPDLDRPMTFLEIPDSFKKIQLPEGFILKSMAEENNLAQMHRIMWRCFEGDGEPPEEGIAERERMQSGPHYRKDLSIYIQALSGDFASFCGIWYDEKNRFGYIEPMATDPIYRRRGLGKSVVLEGIRRCSALGATIVYVWSDLPFYKALGFRKCHVHQCWEKPLA